MDDVAKLLWVERAMNISALLVAIGVSGEFLGNWIAGPIRKRLDAVKETEIARLNKEAGEARKAAGKAIERAAIAEENTEKEKFARLKLEERFAWRRISSKDHDALVAALESHAGATVEVTKLGDMEAGVFADDLIKTLRDSGWLVTVNFAGMMAPPPYGLQCSINENLPAGKLLSVAFKSLPTAAIAPDPNLPVVARILVGLKPPP